MGMLADVQVCWHDTTAHVQRLFLPKVLKQMTVMSLDDVTDILLMYIGVGIEGSMHKTKGLSGAGSWFGSACSQVSLSGKPQTL